MSPSTPRFRFAPSPTGFLHVGNARAALFNWLEARRLGGEMLLRVEDTDRERSSSELIDNVLDSLRWLGIDWDGDIVLQADNLDAHRAAAHRLLEEGRAYWCDCTTEQVQERARQRGGPPGYDGHCRDRGLAQREDTALRFRTPDEGTTSFTDVVRGEVSFDNATIEDFVLLRSNGLPVFLLSNAYDDATMEITHVVRGEDHVPGTPKYLLLREALGLGRPEVFAHLPLLVNEQRKKLSKRKDAVSVAEFRERGYLASAMVNYLATLGWGPKDGIEVRPLEEIIELFRLEDVTPSPAFFDVKKLQSFNADHIRALSPERFREEVRPFLSSPEVAEALEPLAELVQERVRLLTEVEPMIAFLLDRPLEIDDASWEKAMVKGKAAPEMLDATIERFEALDAWTADAIRVAVEDAATAVGLTNAEGRPQLSKAQAPVRVATTGRSVGPPLFESLEALGRERTLERLRAARARL
ncbi:MAG TPA: glutamate--tRNA ligase [Acidimicrobiales bacterium]|nr:glutamate--tRNA ligase [Acidimicrobiales bacterium]